MERKSSYNQAQPKKSDFNPEDKFVPKPPDIKGDIVNIQKRVVGTCSLWFGKNEGEYNGVIQLDGNGGNRESFRVYLDRVRRD